jgi:hypothetical protein
MSAVLFASHMGQINASHVHVEGVAKFTVCTVHFDLPVDNVRDIRKPSHIIWFPEFLGGLFWL